MAKEIRNRIDTMDLCIVAANVRIVEELCKSGFRVAEITPVEIGICDISLCGIAYIMKINGKIEIAQAFDDHYGTPDYRIIRLNVDDFYRMYTIGL